VCQVREREKERKGEKEREGERERERERGRKRAPQVLFGNVAIDSRN